MSTATTQRFDRRLIAPMILGSVLNPINSSIIAVSLIPIGHALGAPPSQTVWLVSALYLATSIGQPVVGTLVDIYGPRPLYLIGTSLVGVAGILGTIAPNLGVLVLARVVLGFGTCAGYPAAMSLIRSESARTGQESPSAILTALAVSNQTVAVVGPSLGGLLIGIGGWRSTFAVNIPLSLACLILGWVYLPRRTALLPGDQRPRLRTLDVAGIAFFAGTLVTLLLFLMTPRADRTYLLAVSALAAIAFALRERGTDHPFIDLRVLAGNTALLATYARSLLTGVVSYAVLYGFTQWLEDGRGLDASQAGLVLLPMFATAILVSSTTGRRPEVKAKLVVGGVTQVLFCALLLLFDAGSTVWALVGLAIIIGIPQGLNNLANQNALYHQADPERIGASAGLLRTSYYLGAIVASAANGIFLRDTAGTAGMHHLAIFVLAIATGCLVLTLVDRSLGGIGRTPAPTNPSP